MTTPSMRSCVVRYGSTRVRYQRPCRVCTSRSIVWRCCNTCSASSVSRLSTQVARDIGQRAPGIERQQVEDVPDARGRELHAQQSIQEDRADLGRVDQVLEVVVRDRQLLDLDLQLLVDGRELLVDRLQLLLARLELLGGRPELLVGRLQFLVRRLRLLDLRLVLLDGGAKLRLQPEQLVFQLLRRFGRERAGELHGRRRFRVGVGRIGFREQDEEEAARGLLMVQDGPHGEVDATRLAVDRDLYACDLHVHTVAARTVERCPQFDPQLGPDQPHQVAREITAADLQVLGGALRHVHHLVLLGDNDRRRRVLLEKAEVEVRIRQPVGDAWRRALQAAAAPAAAPG